MIVKLNPLQIIKDKKEKDEKLKEAQLNMAKQPQVA
jgi:hypothetical protein